MTGSRRPRQVHATTRRSWPSTPRLSFLGVPWPRSATSLRFRLTTPGPSLELRLALIADRVVLCRRERQVGQGQDDRLAIDGHFSAAATLLEVWLHVRLIVPTALPELLLHRHAGLEDLEGGGGEAADDEDVSDEDVPDEDVSGADEVSGVAAGGLASDPALWAWARPPSDRARAVAQIKALDMGYLPMRTKRE